MLTPVIILDKISCCTLFLCFYFQSNGIDGLKFGKPEINILGGYVLSLVKKDDFCAVLAEGLLSLYS